MSDSRALLQQALEALRGYRREIGDEQPCDAERALEAALEQPEQLPLDFSATDSDAALPASGPGAVVYQIDAFRCRSGQNVSLSAVYEAIHDAVKHVTGGVEAATVRATDQGHTNKTKAVRLHSAPLHPPTRSKNHD
jgi:hypothetical protein